MNTLLHRLYSAAPRSLSVLLVALVLVLPLAARAQKPVDLPPPPPDAEGLVRQHSRGLDEVYLRPGARFADYHRVLVAPVDVSFARYWARDHRDIKPEESQRLRADLAKLAHKEFVRDLQREGGYAIAQAPGPDVLEVRTSIVNLDLSAPEISDAAVRRTWVLSAGEGTLIAELRDSQTGTLLARVVDRREMRRYEDLQIANSVTNSAEARDLVSAWSRLLRRQIESAKADSKGP